MLDGVGELEDVGELEGVGEVDGVPLLELVGVFEGVWEGVFERDGVVEGEQDTCCRIEPRVKRQS